MKTALIIYGSTTGNTEYVAETLADYLKGYDWEVTLSNVADAGVDELETNYSLYLLGCSTWGEEEIELQDDFNDFYDNMTGDLRLSGKLFAIFGCGDSSYEHFCGAVDSIEDRVVDLGATIAGDSLKIDGDPEPADINEWIADITSQHF